MKLSEILKGIKSYDIYEDKDIKLRDKDGHVCSGYVIASRTQGEDSYQAYISCPDYTTDGFEDWRS